MDNKVQEIFGSGIMGVVRIVIGGTHSCILYSNFEYMVLRVFMFALMVMVAFGCKKPVTPIPPTPVNPTNPVTPDEFSVLIDGVKWTPTKYKAGYTLSPSSSHVGHDTALVIEAYDTLHNQWLSFSISRGNAKIGKYESPGTAGSFLLHFYFQSNISTSPRGDYSDLSGNVTITKISDNRIEGTFNAIMDATLEIDTISFTNGVFKIPYKPL